MNAQQRDHLLKLADILDNLDTERTRLVMPELPPVEFDMRQWHCGTAACAIGYAMYHPYFNALGLHASDNSWAPVPHYQQSEDSFAYSGFGAIQELFGIRYYDADRLFSAYVYEGYDEEGIYKPSLVAWALREFALKAKLDAS
jgi:hypothetical protein